MRSILSIAFVLVCGFAAADDCCSAKKSADNDFWATAEAMMAKSTPIGKKAMSAEACEDKGECCMSKPEKKVMKAEKGCCNEPKQAAKFKIWADGKYAFFGCPISAGKAREEMLAKGMIAGKVQAVSSKVQIG